MSLMLSPAALARRKPVEADDYYQVGQAFGLLNKEAAAPIATPVLHGRLIVSKSGWALLTVPNALVRGLFDAMDEKGIELPPGHEGGPFTAHISVMRGEEVDKIGGPDKISERGHPFSYQLGPIMSVEPKGWSDMSRVWFAKVISPELKALRKSYGLDPLPNGDHDFHISVAVRRKNVLSQGPVSKAAADERDEGDGEDVHSDYSEDVHPEAGDDDDNDQKPKLPLVMRRIVYSETHISRGEPEDDDNGIKQFMDHIRERSRKPDEKRAADYVFHGDVQGVGLRRNLHRILEEQGRPGLAYNDARSGQTFVSLPGRSRSHGPVFKALDEHLKDRGADYSFTQAPGREKHQPHTMTDKDIATFLQRQGFSQLGSETPAVQRKWLADRWRLKETPEGHLKGTLPPLAIAQLQGKQPVYSEQLTGGGGYGPNPWNQKTAAVRALARLTGEKRADLADIVVPGLLGAGMGGMGGYGVGQLMGSKHPWRDTLYGAGAGGLLGTGLGLDAAPIREIEPPRPGGESLAEHIKHYYKNAPGGFEGALDSALKHQRPISRVIGAPTYTKEDVYKHFPIVEKSIREMSALPGEIKGLLLGQTRLHTPEPDYKPGDPPVTISLLDPKTRLMSLKTRAPISWKPQLTKEHELTHATMMMQPLHRIVSWTPPIGGIPTVGYRSGRDLVAAESPRGVVPHPMSDDLNYRFSPAELDPRLAEIKRQYVLANPGKDVRTPEQAQEALKWFYGWFNKPEGRRALGIHSDDWGEMFAYPDWHTIERAATQRMPGLVQNLPAPGSMKMAALDTQIASGLIGAGLGGLGGYGVGKARKAKRPWMDALIGAGLGGALGASLPGHGSAITSTAPPRPKEPTKLDVIPDPTSELEPEPAGPPKTPEPIPEPVPPRSKAPSPPLPRQAPPTEALPFGTTQQTLRGNTKHYYQNTEGGYEGTLGSAIAAQKPWAPGIGTPTYTAADVDRKIPVTVQKDKDPLPSGVTPDMAAWSITNYRRPGYTPDKPPLTAGILGSGDPRLAAREQQSLEHELTHSSLLQSPGMRGKGPSDPIAYHSGNRLLSALDPSIKPNSVDSDTDYFLSPAELDVRLAQIKRRYADTFPGRDVRSPGEARKAIEWWRNYVQSPEAKEELGNYDTGDWKTIFGLPGWKTVAPAAAERMPGLVQNLPMPGSVKMAVLGYGTVPKPMGTVAAQPVPGTVASPPPPPLKPMQLAPAPMPYRPPTMGLQQRPQVPGWPKPAPAPARAMPASMKLAADYAPGLPSKKDYGPWDRLRVGQMLDYIVQSHNADRAGPHHDIRFGDKDTGLFSWASRKGVPAPGEKRLAVQQPVHRHDYKDFEGEIPEGYGKGTVKKHTEGQVLITKVTPESIHFTTAHQRHPERYTLARPKGWGSTNWLMMNTTPQDKVPYEKVRYKKIPANQVEPHLRAMQEGDSAEAKLDGASQLVQLAKGHAEMLSFRTSTQTGRPIFHTERFFGGRPDIPVPKHLEGSILKGEMYAAHHGGPATGGDPAEADEPGGKGPSRNGRAARTDQGGDQTAPVRIGTPQDVGTLVNSSIARSLQLQKERGMSLKNMLYDIQQYGKTPIDPAVTPRNERRKMLEEVAQHLPKDKFHVSEEVKDPEAAVKLWNLIRSGKHDLTREGVVVHPRVGVPSKGKLFEEHDVVLRGTFPGEGKRKATIGGFTYSHTPKGPVVGKVGGGFSDSFLREAARDPSAYIGRVARLSAQEKLPSTALRHPNFIALHEDYNPEQVNKTAGLFGFGDPVSSNVVGSDDQTMPGVMGGPIRKRRPPPPPTWLESLRRTFWGEPHSIVPEAIEAITNQEKAGAVTKLAIISGVTKPPLELPKDVFAPTPTPTAAALGQLAARPGLPPMPFDRAAPAQAQITKILAARPEAADRLAASLHGVPLRAGLTEVSRNQGYPKNPSAAPASTTRLLGQIYPHALPQTNLENAALGHAFHDMFTGETTISDPQRPGLGATLSSLLSGGAKDQRSLDAVMPNRLAVLRHETEHGLQSHDLPRFVRPPIGAPQPTIDQARKQYRRKMDDWSNSAEIPASLGDFPFIAQAHKLETGKPLTEPMPGTWARMAGKVQPAQVNLAPGITQDADWMARQAQQHGLFGGRTSTTEQLATPAGQSYLKRLLDAYSPPPSPLDKL